ncbi:MAG: hypothetical protein KGL26_07750 [Pseudomonadota bacterium]|nr:hypothetical protein [Pseudomonadota bacterium]
MAETAKTSLIRNPLVLGGAAVVVVALAAGGYFLLKPAAPKLDAHGKPIPSLCEATLTRAVDYGVVEGNAKLASTEAAATQTKNRMVCKAKLGSAGYTLTADVACDDVSDEKCLKLYSVTDAAGNSLFQRQM